VRRAAAREWDGVIEDSTGHGGKRVANVHMRSSEEHCDYISLPRMHASAWFACEKETHAEEQPNEIGGGVYQIDKIELKEYYNDFRMDMEDSLSLQPCDVASFSVWKKVWDEDHPDLVMRAYKNVDHKDKVRIVIEAFELFLNFICQVRENLRIALLDRRSASLRHRDEIRALRSIYRRTIAGERAYYYREIQYAVGAPFERISFIIDGASQE